MLTAEGRNTDFANMSLEDMAFGNAMDSYYTFLLYEALKEEMEEKMSPIFKKFYKVVLQPLTEHFPKVTANGIDVEVSKLETLEQEGKDLLMELHDNLYGFDNVIHTQNVGSSKDLIRILYLGKGEKGKLIERESCYNLLWPDETENGDPSTDRKSFNFLLDAIDTELSKRG